MTSLTHRDWQTLTAAIETLHSEFDPQTLAERTLIAASNVIAADSVGFTGFRNDGVFAGLVWENSSGYSPDEMAAFAAFIHENPLATAFFIEKRTDTLKITDLMEPAEFERTNIYNEFYKPVGVSNQLVTPMRISQDLLITCTMNIGNGDFSERDRSVLTLIAPHIANAIRNAYAYERLNDALESEAYAVVVVNSETEPLFISDRARALLRKYFAAAKYPHRGLPPEVREWAKRSLISPNAGEFRMPPTPMKKSDERGELTLRLNINRQTGEQSILLEERTSPSPLVFHQLGLTNRESEILSLIAQGNSDPTIARLLGKSVRTVQKHVENIYRKLGVETRTAAMLRAWELR